MQAAGQFVTGLVAAAFAAGAAMAQDPVDREVTQAADAEVTLHMHSFLEAEELLVLRQIAASSEARLALLGETAGGHAAIAVAPEEGFFRDGVPASSAAALSDLPDAQTARDSALAACEAARAAPEDESCVVILELAPVQ